MRLKTRSRDSGMLEMLSMLQELQSMHQPTRLVMISHVKTEKKASKSSSRSVAFQAKKNALFTDARGHPTPTSSLHRRTHAHPNRRGLPGAVSMSASVKHAHHAQPFNPTRMWPTRTEAS